MVLSRLIVLINGRLMAVGRDIAGDHRRPHHLSSARFWWRLDGYGARYARKPLRVGYAADAMVFSVFPVYYGLELPRVISLNMARQIPTLFWYVSPKSPPQYQGKKTRWNINLVGLIFRHIRYFTITMNHRCSWWQRQSRNKCVMEAGVTMT